MRIKYSIALLASIGLMQVAVAQPPNGPNGGRGGRGGPGQMNLQAMVERLMTMDADGDGQLSKDELASDQRLANMFVRADSNSDSVVTKVELTSFFTKESASGQGPFDRGGPGQEGMGPGGPGGGPGFGPPPGGFGGPGGPGPGPQFGVVLPEFMVSELGLTETQKKQLQKLQADVTTRLNKILTQKQRDQLKAHQPPHERPVEE